MNFIISADTDIGTTKSTNQDSLSVKLLHTNQGRMAFAVLCDGMGGLDKGEVASASVIRAFDKWVRERFPLLCNQPLEDGVIRSEWEGIIQAQNELLHRYGASIGVSLGTTVVTMLVTEYRVFILNVGDSRAYMLDECTEQLTRDQTFIAREIELGNMTPEQAQTDSRRNVLLQCVGASDEVYPEMFFRDTRQGVTYLLCSDGFRHEITPEEIYAGLSPNVLLDEYSMRQGLRRLIDLNKRRQERDNISALLIRTF